MFIAPPQSNGRLPSRLVDGARLWQRMQALSHIGATAAGGVERPALSALEAAARLQVMDWARRFGARAHGDAVGNLFLMLDGVDRNLTPVLTGSHVDTPIEAGKYSGAYGVAAALEALTAIADHGGACRRSIVLVCWTNGQGRFGSGCLGADAFTGIRPLADVLAAEDGGGTTVATALSALLPALGDLPQVPLGFDCAAYVEAQGENGAMLEQQRSPIGVGTGSTGARRFRIAVTAPPGHSSMALRNRRDALSASVRILAALEKFLAAPDVGFTVSQMQATPNAPSTVPREVTFSLEIRHHDATVLTRLGDTMRLICDSEKGFCRVVMTELAGAPAVAYPPALAARIGRVAQQLGLAHVPIMSAGGHEAQILGLHCPTGVIFVACKDGSGHDGVEVIDPHHAAAGARVLTDVLWQLAND